MSTLVIDASIAIKWLIDEEGTAQALMLRRRAKLIAPELLVAECANILWKKVRRDELSTDEALLAARLLQTAEIELLPTRALLESATRIAIELGHPAYDCLYLALAIERGCRFVTADERLLRKLGQEPNGRLGDRVLSLSEAALLPSVRHKAFSPLKRAIMSGETPIVDKAVIARRELASYVAAPPRTPRMQIRFVTLAAVSLVLAAGGWSAFPEPSRAADPAVPTALPNPAKDCRPCRFSPGKGQPAFDLTFVFDGTGDDRALTGFDIAPVAGGKAQHLETGDIEVSSFPDGFGLDSGDLTNGGHPVLGLITNSAADNDSEEYWLYDPASGQFAALDRGDDPGGDCLLKPAEKPGTASCGVKGSLAESTVYTYRIEGHRTVAIRADEVAIDGNRLVHRVSDLTAKPSRAVSQVTIGYVGDSPERTAFLKQLSAAWQRAGALYKAGDKAGAAAAMELLLKDKDPRALTSTYPPSNDPSDRQIVAEFNDYGFYLEEAGRAREAVAVLSAVIDLDDKRIPAYLNLADAQYATGNVADAKADYAEYTKRMAAAGMAVRIPPRVVERLR